ncbi:MAG: thiamine pyrophosphate-binding protein, partial [Clostridia bacterium]|nr:thiamine pyrophosphate-binding protein [Clostridia bacterium]
MYGTIRMNQEREFPGRVVGSDLGNPDLAKLAEAFGAHGERVTRDAEVRPALKRALAAGKPAVVDVLTNRQRISVMGTIEDFRRAGRPSGAERWSL